MTRARGARLPMTRAEFEAARAAGRKYCWATLHERQDRVLDLGGDLRRAIRDVTDEPAHHHRVIGAVGVVAGRPTHERRSARRYSVAELDRMRRAIHFLALPSPGLSYYPDELDRRVEDQLRIHMQNGTDPAELEEAANARGIAEWSQTQRRTS